MVSDNGRGIHPEHIDNVFEMFYRATEDSQGSGLGLYIVKETVEKLQGTIYVRSTAREGTTFTLEIPNLGLSGTKGS
jgi:signal transduction histidine kinase